MSFSFDDFIIHNFYINKTLHNFGLQSVLFRYLHVINIKRNKYSYMETILKPVSLY